MLHSGAWIPLDGATLRVLPYSPRVLRLTYGPADGPEPASFSVTAPLPADPVFETRTADGKTVVSAGELTVTVGDSGVTVEDGRTSLTRAHGFSLTPCEITRQTGGDVTFRQTVDGLRASREGGEASVVRQSNHGTITVDFTEDETIFGLGSHEEGWPNLRGQFVPLYQENMRIAVPVFVSTKGYAVLLNCASFMTFDATDHRRGKFYLDSADAVDFWLIDGGDFAGVCRALRALTGETPMLPKWTLGYIQSKERYAAQDEVLAVARRYREEGIPIDGLVQDWLYWRDGLWGDKHFDPQRYPDPAALTAALHGMD